MGMACQNCTLFQTQSRNNQHIGICYASFVRGLFDETFGKTQWILLSLNNKQSGNKDSSGEGFIEGMVTPTEWSGNIVNLYVNDNGLDFFILKKKQKNCLYAPHLAVF